MKIDWWRVHHVAFNVAVNSVWFVLQYIITGFVGLLFCDFLWMTGAIVALIGSAVMLIAVLVCALAYRMAGPPSRLC